MKDAKAAGVAIAVVFIVVIGVLLVQSITGYLTLPRPGPSPGGAVLCTDNDKDGYYALGPNKTIVCTPIDCNDNDQKINPGFPEIYGDKIDNDCDGRIDEVEPNVQIMYIDSVSNYNYDTPMGHFTSNDIIGKNRLQVCQKMGYKQAVSAGYQITVYYSDSMASCNQRTTKSIEAIYSPARFEFKDFSGGCTNKTDVLNLDNSAFTTTANTPHRITSTIVLTCWR